MAKLIIYQDLDANETIYETFELSSSRILIGSAEDNHLILETSEVDPTHASLELRDAHWFLQDLGGPGGTAVNGALIDGPRLLAHDDLIELGFVRIRFHHFDETEDQTETQRLKVREEKSTEPEEQAEGPILRGRIWFAAVAGGTFMIILAIFLLFFMADYFELITILDLLPPWLSD